MTSLEGELIPSADFSSIDEVLPPLAVLHQRHRSDEFASPVGIIVLEAADIQDEMWWHLHFLANPVDVRLRVVFVGWCPPFDDGTHGCSFVLHSIGSQQSEGSTIAPLHRLELIKTLVVLHWEQTLPLILAPADIQRIAIS